MTRAEIIALTKYDLCPYCTKTQLRKHGRGFVNGGWAECSNEGCTWLECVTCGLVYDPVAGRVGSKSGFRTKR